MRKILTKYKNLTTVTKATLWYTIANILVKGVALLSTPIFTRVMTETEYGTYSIFQSWYGIILIFTSLNIFLGGYTKGLLKYKDEVDSYTSSSLSMTTFITCCWSIVYLINISFWTNIFELTPHMMAAMFIELLIMPAYELWSSKSRFAYKYKTVVFASVWMSMSSIIFGVIAVLTNSHRVVARVDADIFAKATVAVPIFILLIAKGRTLFNKKFWKYNFLFNLPLIPHYLSNYALNQSDRLMISRMIGNAQAAYYSVAYTIATMMNLVVTAINNALTPYIYQSINAGKSKEIKKTTAPAFFIMALMCIVTMAFAPELIMIFAGKKYTQAIYVVPPVAASVYFIFLYGMFSTIEYYYQKTVRIAIATFISAALNVVLNYVFIKAFGYYAAGYTTLVSYILLAFLHYRFYRSVLREEAHADENLYDMRAIMLSAILVLAVMFIMTLTYKEIWLRYGIITVICVIEYIKRDELKKMLSQFKAKN
ncbi:lipopolysaccharide biosynthesis protein [Bilifractor sp. HCP3S3_D3]|uniref:lipopolysaccharide biosynthesis protein n=1 Tax=Bilifractor sp. HCP3S3_D3 TaxID=3438907 RepID=UPI003F8A07A8